MAPRTHRRGLSAAWPWLVLLVLTACGRQEPDPVPPEGGGDFPAQRTFDYSTRHSRDAVPVWELFGDIAEQYEGSDDLILTGVRMVFYRDGALDAVLTSRSGEIDQVTEATTARGNVVTEDGRRLESEVLHWDPEREMIHTEEFVRFTEGDQVLTGYGLETDPDLANVLIKRQVRGTSADGSPPSDDPER